MRGQGSETARTTTFREGAQNMAWLRNNRLASMVAAAFVMQLAFLPGIRAAEKPQEASGQLGSVDITGEAKDKVVIEKVSPEIKIKISDMVDSVTDKTEKLLEQGKPIPADEDYNRFNKLSS